MTKEQIIAKLTSRKFWSGLVGMISGLALIFGADENTAQMIGGVVLELGSIIAYCMGEGIADAARAKVVANENQ